MKNSCVLDACALIAFFKREEGWDFVGDLIEKSVLGELRLSMSKYNLLEVYYGFYGNDGREKAVETLQDSLLLPIRIVEDLNDAIFLEAGRLKATYGISLADAVALGLASVTGESLVTSDHHELSVIDRHEEIDIIWFR